MKYYVPDTDHVSIFQRQSEPAFSTLKTKLARFSPDLIFVTIISFQEQFQGWMSYINKATSASQLIMAYHELEKIIQYFST